MSRNIERIATMGTEVGSVTQCKRGDEAVQVVRLCKDRHRTGIIVTGATVLQVFRVAMFLHCGQLRGKQGVLPSLG